MGRTNACRAQQKRERNLAKTKAKAGSQLKVNEAACTIICAVCRTSFLSVTSAASLRDHSDNRHPTRAFEECFPGVPAA